MSSAVEAFFYAAVDSPAASHSEAQLPHLPNPGQKWGGGRIICARSSVRKRKAAHLPPIKTCESSAYQARFLLPGVLQQTNSRQFHHQIGSTMGLGWLVKGRRSLVHLPTQLPPPLSQHLPGRPRASNMSTISEYFTTSLASDKVIVHG